MTNRRARAADTRAGSTTNVSVEYGHVYVYVHVYEPMHGHGFAGL